MLNGVSKTTPYKAKTVLGQRMAHARTTFKVNTLISINLVKLATRTWLPQQNVYLGKVITTLFLGFLWKNRKPLPI